jgi:hypothetical protein
MQFRLKIALIAAGFALASCPAFAIDLPSDGTKNFSAPSEAPSYFSNEMVPESDRVNHQATFDSEEVPESASAPDVSQGTDAGGYGRHTTAYRSARHAHGRYYMHGGSRHFAGAAASGTPRTSALHNPSHGNRIYAPKHARVGTRQHV